MSYSGEFQVFENIIKEIMIVYKHDNRPWLIGYSGGKDSTLLTCLVYEAMKRGFLNIGVAMQMPNSTKWSFSISPTQLAEYLGIDIPTLNDRLAHIRGERSLNG